MISNALEGRGRGGLTREEIMGLFEDL